MLIFRLSSHLSLRLGILIPSLICRNVRIYPSIPSVVGRKYAKALSVLTRTPNSSSPSNNNAKTSAERSRTRKYDRQDRSLISSADYELWRQRSLRIEDLQTYPLSTKGQSGHISSHPKDTNKRSTPAKELKRGDRPIISVTTSVSSPQQGEHGVVTGTETVAGKYTSTVTGNLIALFGVQTLPANRLGSWTRVVSNGEPCCHVGRPAVNIVAAAM